MVCRTDQDTVRSVSFQKRVMSSRRKISVVVHLVWHEDEDHRQEEQVAPYLFSVSSVPPMPTDNVVPREEVVAGKSWPGSGKRRRQQQLWHTAVSVSLPQPWRLPLPLQRVFVVLIEEEETYLVLHATHEAALADIRSHFEHEHNRSDMERPCPDCASDEDADMGCKTFACDDKCPCWLQLVEKLSSHGGGGYAMSNDNCDEAKVRLIELPVAHEAWSSPESKEGRSSKKAKVDLEADLARALAPLKPWERDDQELQAMQAELIKLECVRKNLQQATDQLAVLIDKIKS